MTRRIAVGKTQILTVVLRLSSFTLGDDGFSLLANYYCARVLFLQHYQ